MAPKACWTCCSASSPEGAAFARHLADDVQAQRLQGLHFWSIDRDRPCEGGAARVAPDCSGLAEPPAGGFTRLLVPR